MSITISPFSVIDETAYLGDDCRVWQFSTIAAGAFIGARCVIGSNCYIGRNSLLGDDVHVNHGVFLPNGSKVGHRVFIGPNVTFTDDKHPRVNNADYVAEPPYLEEDANVGAGAVILPGVRLGKGCTIGAGAVVTRDVPAGETWIGVPAKRQHRLPEPPPDGGWFWKNTGTVGTVNGKTSRVMEITREVAEMPQGTWPKKPKKPSKPKKP